MAETSDIALHDVAPKYKAEKVENWAAAFRGKENARITDENATYTPLFEKAAVKQEGMRDNIQGLETEFAFLQRLEHTGVTPRPLAFTTNDKQTEGHLLMTAVSGESLEGIEPDDAMRENFGNILKAMSRSLHAIHEEMVLLRDINEGTFVLDRPASDDVSCSVVDFELALTQKDIDNQDSGDDISADWYGRKDIGFDLARRHGKTLDMDTAQGSERYQLVKTLVDSFVGATANIAPEDLPDDVREQYNRQYAQIKDEVAEITRDEIRNAYRTAVELELDYREETEEAQIELDFDQTFNYKMRNAMLHITAPYLLRENGCVVDDDTAHYLSHGLEMAIDKRPRDIGLLTGDRSLDEERKLEGVKDMLAQLSEH